MYKGFWVAMFLPLVAGFCGCAENDAEEDTGNPWDDTETDGTGDPDVDYVCIDDSKPVDEESCGPYPAHDNEMWDLYAVVPNTQFKAYYDRNCDGEPELTTMRMYEDVYCQRDTVKSLVLLVGSNCGTGGES